MNTYLITYDLNKQKDYPALYEAIKAISNNWSHPIDSTWFVATDLNALQIHERLLKVIDEDDDLIVARMARGDYAYHLHNNEIASWLNNSL